MNQMNPKNRNHRQWSSAISPFFSQQGKTNIAMLAIVNQIKQCIVNGVLRKDDFKIVYIAPMKALAAEMVANFGKRLEPLGIVVKELTGDIQLTKQEIMQTQMLIATPEKWDVVTRKSLGDVSLSLLVRLLIIDEVCEI
jgi:activating signal cointegrator complex subunit 3